MKRAMVSAPRCLKSRPRGDGSERHYRGQLANVCDSWVYCASLCLALDTEKQERWQFRSRYLCLQLEYSLFERHEV